MFHSAESLTQTTGVSILKSSAVKHNPLRSVENQLNLHEDIYSKQSGTRCFKMNGANNNNWNFSTKIRTEPFLDNYVIEEEIGRGKFAVVKRSRHKTSGIEYAAKFQRKRRRGRDCRHDILHEINMLELALLHPRLVNLVEVYETSHEIIIVTEYAMGGELFQYVVEEEKIKEKDAKRMMRQLLEGLMFMHSRNVVHLDVKPHNILLTKGFPQGNIKLCDFGFSRMVHSGEDVRDIIGTPDYVAPEVLNYDPIHTSADLWSCGVVAYVILTGYSPFAGDTKQETFFNISQVNLDFPDDLFKDVSREAKDFMMKLLKSDPSERMTARESLQHPWLASSPRSPVGSPIGCRRALTPPSADNSAELEGLEEPKKRSKCDEDCASSSGDVGPEDSSIINGDVGTEDCSIIYGDVGTEDCTIEKQSVVNEEGTIMNGEVDIEDYTTIHRDVGGRNSSIQSGGEPAGTINEQEQEENTTEEIEDISVETSPLAKDSELSCITQIV